MNTTSLQEIVKALLDLAEKEDEAIAPYAETLKIAAEMLLQQEPVKPKATPSGLFCGNCDKYIRWFDRFCPNCGKKVGEK